MLPMVIEGFIKILSECLLSLINHSFAYSFDFLDHDSIEAFRCFELGYSGENGLDRLIGKSSIDLFDDEADDFRDGIDFVVGKKCLDFKFVHLVMEQDQNLMIKNK